MWINNGFICVRGGLTRNRRTPQCTEERARLQHRDDVSRQVRILVGVDDPVGDDPEVLFEVLLRDDAARYSAVWVARIGEFSERRAMTTTERRGLTCRSRRGRYPSTR